MDRESFWVLDRLSPSLPCMPPSEDCGSNPRLDVNTWICAQVDGEKLDWFRADNRVRKGDPMTPDLMRKLTVQCGML